MQNTKVRFFCIALLAMLLTFLTGCPNGTNVQSSEEPAASVNGKAIKLEEVERALKQQTQGQESKLSPLELAAARLEVLQGLIQQEVMYQKAEKEGTVPTEEEITAEVNKRKTESRVSQEEFAKRMEQAGLTEATFRETVKKGLAIQKLVDKVTGKIEPPKDSEIEEFYKGNPDLFVKKRGVRLSAIVIDPSNSGQGDKTTNETEANLVVKEVLEKIKQGADFAALASEYSEDPSKFRQGDLGYISEAELKQNFGEQIAGGFMSPQFTTGQVTNMIPLNGKGYIFKLTERNEKDENLTLESPNIRQQITDQLVNSRKQLLAASYQAIAMNEAKVENYLARKVVENPNELSGARPAGASTPPVNTNANVSTDTNTNAAANSNTAGNANANADSAIKPAANAANAANANAK